MKYKTELTNKVQLCFSLRKYQKNLSDNWKVSHQWICADKHVFFKWNWLLIQNAVVAG